MKLKTILFIAAFLFCSQIPLVGASQIIIQDADSTWNSTASYSEGLTNITSGVTPRIPVEYSKTLYHNILISSSDLLNATSSVTPRIVVEYANSNYRKDLNEIPTDLENLTSEVASRIIMEYATSNYEKQLIFPEGLINDTTPPNNPPTASCTYTTEGLVATFTSTSSDSDDGIASYHWDFGDGAISTEKDPVHTYPASGNYIVMHTVKDSHGRTDSITEEIPVSSIIQSVSCPSSVAKGLPLRVEVRTNLSASITASISGFSDTKYGKHVEFIIDTSGFGTGKYDLTITADGDTYQTPVRIFDQRSYQEVVHGLNDLDRAAEDEMHEISWITGHSLACIAYEKSAEKGIKKVFDEFRFSTLISIKTGYIGKVFDLQMLLVKEGLSDEAAADLGDIAYDMGDMIGDDLAEFAGKQVYKLPEAVIDRSIPDVLTELITERVVYFTLCSQAEGIIDERTEAAKSQIQSQSYTPEELTRMKELLAIGQEAIKNTDGEKIYRLHIGTIPIVKKDINAEPTMYYFKESHDRSLNPGGWGFGQYNPKWVLDMTLADAQSVLTLPAKIGWIEATPEDEEIKATTEVRPTVAFIPVIIEGVKAYVKAVKFIKAVSPSVISGGMLVSTDLLANEINEEHDDTINAMLSVSGFSMKSTNTPVLVGEDLKIPKGDTIVTITPDGRIVDIEFTKTDVSIKPPAEYTIVSLNAGKSYRIEAETPDITLQLTSDKENYLLNQTAYITVNITNSMNEAINDTLLWLVVPSENLTIKDSLNLSAHSEIIINYNFTVSNESLHVQSAFLTIFDEILAEGYCSFTVGGSVQQGAVMTIDHQEFYDPGTTITMNVMVENVGNVEITPVLIYDGSFIFLPALQPKETTTEIATFNYTEPGIYSISFILVDTNGTLDVQSIEFTVRAIDTLLAFPSTNKPYYNLSESASVSVIIKNATLHTVSFPYNLKIVTPSGNINNETTFIAGENGTYTVKAAPIASGYATVSGDTLFMVERQSDLKMAVSRSGNTVLVYVKTDAGGAVEDASVILNGIKKATDSNGIARFEYVNATEVLVKAEKFGFNPVISTVNISEESFFDTKLPANPYPSISGVHNGTIMPNQTIIISKLYTYPCSGTGGHTEYVRIFGNGINKSASWKGYVGDWHTITFNDSFILEEWITYNYTIKTGSYPQIIHEREFNAAGGIITCTEFVDVNGKRYNNWIPAIRLE